MSDYPLLVKSRLGPHYYRVRGSVNPAQQLVVAINDAIRYDNVRVSCCHHVVCGMERLVA